MGLNGIVYMARQGTDMVGSIGSNNEYAFVHQCALKAHRVPDVMPSIRGFWVNLSDMALLQRAAS